MSMRYTPRLLNQIPPPTVQLFVCLSIIAVIGIIAVALANFSQSGDVLRHSVSTLQHAKI